jgi:DNA-binding FadR family transcriptional regulator
MGISFQQNLLDSESSLGSLTKQIVTVLGTAIVTGKYQPGAPFPVEAELCEQYGASRTAVREALKVLNAKGLINSRPRRGTSVRATRYWNVLDPDVLRWMLRQNFSVGLLIEFTQMRLAIEPAAARAAAESGDTRLIAPIAKALDRMQAASDGKDDPLEADIAFHLAILDASDNRFFLSMRTMVEAALNFSIRYTNRAKGITVGEIKDHAAIYNAIKAGKGDAAEKASRALLTEALALIREGADVAIS